MKIRVYALSLMLAMTVSGLALAEDTVVQPAAAEQQPTTSLIPAEAAPAVQQPTTSLIPVETAPPAQASVATPVMQAAISQQAPLTAKDMLSVIQAPATINNGSLSGKYHAVRITLKNQKGYHLEVVHGEVANAVDEAFVANEAAQRRNNGRRMLGGLLRGASSLPFVGGFGYASIGAYQAAAVAQTAANTAANIADATSDGQANIEGRYVRSISSAVISPNDEYSFNVLLPKGQAPQLKVVFKALETNQVFDIRQ